MIALFSNRQAEILILQAMRLDRPVIGHCLGGQLMSRALGGRHSQPPA
jgi:GMP synthase (glutamine-hydrolysing)